MTQSLPLPVLTRRCSLARFMLKEPRRPIHFSGGQSMTSHRTPAEKLVRRSSFLLIALFAIAVLSSDAIHHTAHAQTAGGTRMLRTPTVSATQIAFAYAQNIWT